MSRYPFKERSNKVIAAHIGIFANSTLEVLERRYNRMDGEFKALFKKGKISTMNPAKFTVDDIYSYYRMLKDRNVSASTIAHELDALNTLCSYFGNSVIASFKARYPAVRRKRSSHRLETLNDSDIDSIVERGLAIDDSDFRNLRAYAMVALYVGAGLRTVELQHALIKNINSKDPEHPSIYVEYVKGMDSYGEPRTVPIFPECFKVIEKYLKVRREYLYSHNGHSDYIFFSKTNYDYLSGNTIRSIRKIVNQDLELEFDGRMCRRSFGQRLIDEKMSVETTSVCLGHGTTKTTETYYARKRDSTAASEVFNMFDRRSGKN